MGNVETILQEARALAKTALTWADLSNTIFDPLDGLVVQKFPEKEERIKFRKTKVYDELCDLVEKKMEETGVVRGATPKKSGKFVVRLPCSLHSALEREAEIEGTSLNQLVLAKLAVQLDSLAGDKIQKIMQAYLEIRDGYSADKVIADPDLDRKFLRRCRELGLPGTDYDLNWKLMNARKANNLSGFSDIIKTKRYSVGKVIDEFEYASELAVRYIQQMKNVSLDQIICDPELAEEFDKYASRLAPDFSPLEYRWAAFGLRKAGRLGNKADEIAELPELEKFGRVNRIDLEKIPETSGLYLFSSREKPIFASQTDNLHHRLESHIKVSNAGLPNWLWDVKREPLELGIATLPGITRSNRQTMEVIAVREWKPVLNFPRKVA